MDQSEILHRQGVLKKWCVELFFLLLYQPDRHGILLIAKATNVNFLEKDGGLLNLVSGSSYSDTSGRFSEPSCQLATRLSFSRRLHSGTFALWFCVDFLKKRKKSENFIAGNKLFKYLVISVFDWSRWEVCQGRDERAGNNRTPQQPKRDSKKHLFVSAHDICVITLCQQLAVCFCDYDFCLISATFDFA